MPSQSATWASESCRVSLFSGDAIASVEEVFSEITGETPITFAADRQIGQSTATGPWKTGILQVVAYPGRIDFIYGPQVTASPGIILLDGAAIECYEDIVGSVNTWVAHQKFSITRVAIGGRCIMTASSVEDAYQLLASQVKLVRFDYPNIKEVGFRANFPIKSTVIPDLLLNRLSNWSVITLHAGVFNPTGQVNSLSLSHHCVCDIDFNSDAENNSALQLRDVKKLLEEINKHIKNVLDRGIE
jgi:hypothetical protein